MTRSSGAVEHGPRRTPLGKLAEAGPGARPRIGRPRLVGVIVGDGARDHPHGASRSRGETACVAAPLHRWGVTPPLKLLYPTFAIRPAG